MLDLLVKLLLSLIHNEQIKNVICTFLQNHLQLEVLREHERKNLAHQYAAKIDDLSLTIGNSLMEVDFLTKAITILQRDHADELIQAREALGATIVKLKVEGTDVIFNFNKAHDFDGLLSHLDNTHTKLTQYDHIPGKIRYNGLSTISHLQSVVDQAASIIADMKYEVSKVIKLSELHEATAKYSSNNDRLKALFLAADPNKSSLNLRIMDEIVAETTATNLITPIQFQKVPEIALLPDGPNVMHFSGHGSKVGELRTFQGMKSNKCIPVNPDKLTNYFGASRSDTLCVILDLCFSESQAIAISKKINYVVGFVKSKKEVSVYFFVRFYYILGTRGGNNIESAYEELCNCLDWQEVPQHDFPILIKNGIKIPWKKANCPTEYDVFICYNSKDQTTVTEIYNSIVSKEINVWFDDQQISGGDNFTTNIGEQIDKIKTFCIFVGKNGIGTFQNQEIDAIISHSEDKKIIPIILPDAEKEKNVEFPTFLKRYSHIDFRKENYDQNINKLVSSIKTIVQRSKSETIAK